MPDQLTDIRPITEWMHIPVLSTIGAAKSFDDLPIRGWIDVQPPIGARPSDQFCAGVVNGESLLDDGIQDGDFVIFKLTFNIEDLKPGQLVAAFTPFGLLLKHIYYTLDGKARLVSANPAYEDILLDTADVIVQGVAVQVVRQL
jgi:SOS-response transcriptional repressor LexA